MVARSSAVPSSSPRATRRPWCFRSPGRALGQAVARIDVDDDLAADNQAFAAARLARSAARAVVHARQLLPGKRARGIARTSSSCRLDGSPAEDIARLARSHDVVVFDGIAAPAAAARELPAREHGRAGPAVLRRGPGGAAGHPRPAARAR